MKYHKPSFFDDFHCIGSACSDTCCAGWEIEVDETTAEGYLKEPGDFGDRLRRELAAEPEEYYFKLKDNRCPFLNRKNLCDIFIHLGEHRLCDICREHPRFYSWFGDYTEVGLGLCCEEAQRLLFSDSRPLNFIEECTEELSGEEGETQQEECEQMLAKREEIFGILQNRDAGLGSRLVQLLNREEIFRETDRAETYSLGESAHFLIRLFESMESLDETWPAMMRELDENLKELLSGEEAFAGYMSERAFEYEHIAVYLVYRYYPESLFDGLAGIKLCFAAASVLLLYLLDIRRYQKKKSYTLEDRMELSRRYSKEIEYCPENLQLFEDCCIKQHGKMLQSLRQLAGSLRML